MPRYDNLHGYELPDHEDGSKPVCDLYKKLVANREPFLDRARDSALLTIPSLIPEEDHDPEEDFVTPFQSVGAKAVNNLAGKLLDGLFPPGQSFFRLDLDPFVAQELASQAEADDDAGADAKALLQQTTQDIIQTRRAVILELDSSGTRARMFDTLRHLIVAGNVLLTYPIEGATQVFPLSSYVVERAGDGKILSIILEEVVNPATLPEEIREVLGERSSLSEDELKGEKDIYIYTAVYRVSEDAFVQFQEIEGVWFDFEGEEVTDIESLEEIADEDLAWRPLVFNRAEGEDYGRGHVEEYIGALATLEAVSEALVHAAVNAAKLVCLVTPAGLTSLRAVQSAENGAVIAGREEDVSFLRQDKASDMAFAANLRGEEEQLINRAFLVGDGTQRDKERVTAEEIRMLVRELQHGLGGIYGVLSRELQLPVVRFILRRLQDQERIPEIDGETIKLRVVTGYEAMGQDQDLERLQTFFGVVRNSLGDAALQYFNVRGSILELANATGLDVDNVLLSKEEVAAMQQQALASRMAENAAAPVAGAVAGAAASVTTEA